MIALITLLCIEGTVTDTENQKPDDAWLTLAEIAEELRMSPATIRSWISNGTLRAMRAGRRKWLVRRSELHRMLTGEALIGPEDSPGRTGWRMMDTIAAPHGSPYRSEESLEDVPHGRWLGGVETEWRQALQASAMAPPGPGFLVRIKEIAEAAARKAAALENLGDDAPGSWWQRQSALAGGVLSYELRPGGNRPGPPELWAKLDQTVEQLGRAMEEHSAPAEQHALEELSLILHEIFDAVLEQEGQLWHWPPSIEEPASGDDDAARESDEA